MSPRDGAGRRRGHTFSPRLLLGGKGKRERRVGAERRRTLRKRTPHKCHRRTYYETLGLMRRLRGKTRRGTLSFALPGRCASPCRPPTQTTIPILHLTPMPRAQTENPRGAEASSLRTNPRRPRRRGTCTHGATWATCLRSCVRTKKGSKEGRRGAVSMHAMRIPPLGARESKRSITHLRW